MKRGSLLEKIVNVTVSAANAIIPATATTSAPTVWATTGQAVTTATTSPTLWVGGGLIALVGCGDKKKGSKPINAMQYGNQGMYNVHMDDTMSQSEMQEAMDAVGYHRSAYLFMNPVRYTVPSITNPGNQQTISITGAVPSSQIDVVVVNRPYVNSPFQAGGVYGYYDPSNDRIVVALKDDRGANIVPTLFQCMWDHHLITANYQPGQNFRQAMLTENRQVVRNLRISRGLPP
jgi:hypothetical protein